MPKSKEDPTGQARNRNRASRDLVNRLEKSRIEVTKLFLKIPRTTKTETKVVNNLIVSELVWIYGIDTPEFERFLQEISNILDINLETGAPVMPVNWFYKLYVEVAFRSGGFDDFVETEQMLRELKNEGILEEDFSIVSFDPDVISNSTIYRRALAKEYAVNYQSVKTLSQATAIDVFAEIQRAIESGQNTKVVGNAIAKRFDVAKFNARRIARTEINAAYNNAKLELTTLAEEQFDISLGNMHISALVPTTRVTHARRHGLAYSVHDQLTWWNTSPNRINCLCTTRKVAIDKKGNVLNKEFQEDVKEEGKAYFAEFSESDIKKTA